MTLAFEFRPYRTAFTQPLQTAHGDWAEREGVIIRLADESGRTTLGEIAPIPWFGTETLDQAFELCRSFGPQVDPERLAGISDALPCCQFAFGSALEALGDEPVAPSARTLLDSRAIARLLPAGPTAIAAAEGAVRQGYTRLKWKVGVADGAVEISLLRKLVGILPSGVLMRLDANGAWDRATANAWIGACEGMPVEFIEQPFPAGQDDALMEIGTAHPKLFALDESVTPPGELCRWLDRGWPGIVVVKPSLGGEPNRLRRLLVETGADVVFSTALETAIGWRAALQFALGHPTGRRALGFGAGRLFQDEALNPPDAEPTVGAGATIIAPAEEKWTQLAQ